MKKSNQPPMGCKVSWLCTNRREEASCRSEELQGNPPWPPRSDCKPGPGRFLVATVRQVATMKTDSLPLMFSGCSFQKRVSQTNHCLKKNINNDRSVSSAHRGRLADYKLGTRIMRGLGCFIHLPKTLMQKQTASQRYSRCKFSF